MRKIIFLFIFCIPSFLFAQGLTNLWMTGYDGSAAHFGITNIDFNSSPPLVYQYNRPMWMCLTNTSITDKFGNLLFYTNGIYIANRYDDTLYNGSNFNTGDLTTSQYCCGLGIPQGVLVIPLSLDSSKYYIFSQSAMSISNSVQPVRLTCSLLDMNLDNGKGGLVWKNTTVINSILSIGQLTACKHANGRDWWVTVHKYQTGGIYKLLVTPHGISAPTLQTIGHVTGNFDGNGQAVFSPDGKKYAVYDTYNFLQIFDFDRCTGVFSNPVFMQINDSALTGGAAFSPDSRYLYISSYNYVYQFDMKAANILGSKTTIAKYDGYYSSAPVFTANFFLMQLAPDGKIYINTSNGTEKLHVINYPDSAGLACDLQQHSFNLLTYNAGTIPNFPNYSLGADSGSICDTVHLGIRFTDFISDKESLIIYPNPARDELFVECNTSNQSNYFITNAMGQTVLTLSSTKKNFKINITSLPTGLYYLKSRNSKETSISKFIKI